MRRALILLLLLLGVRTIEPLGAAGHGSQPLLVFGFLILAAYTVGEIAPALRVPKIVGYLVAGVLFGPYALGVVSVAGVDRLAPVSQLAIALIAFLAGAELRWSEVRERGTQLLKIMTVELALTFVVLTAAVYALARFMPFLAGAGAREVLAFSLLFASIAIVHSPAVTMALLSETGARGPVARSTLGIVLISDVAVVLLFSGMLWVARALVPVAGAVGMNVGLVAWEIGGAMIIGAVLGAGIALYLRFVGRELMLFAVLVAFFGIELARILHVELLLTLLTAGFVTENISSHGERLRHSMERSAAPVFVVFFALSGATINIGEVAPLMSLVLPLAVIRAIAIRTGVQIGAKWAKVSAVEQRYVWLGLVSQVGVAIGLAAIVADAYPVLGSQLHGMLLALIAVNQTVGPVLFRRALDGAGEINPAAAPSAPQTRESPA